MRNDIITYHTFLLLLFIQTSSLVASAQELKYSPTVEKKIKEVESSLGLWVHIEGEKNMYALKERMAFYKVKGVSIAVIKDYKIEWARGFGWADSAEQRKVTAGTLFQAASISKSLNGIGVLKLVQDGKLNLSSDINNYLKPWKFPYDSVSKGKKITTAHLLSHTAGLTISGFPGYAIGTKLSTLSQILDGTPPANTKAVRSAFEPGLKYQYSGGGTTISQMIVENITGKQYSNYMWENVLKPMGMKNSFYKQSVIMGKENVIATAYDNDGIAVKGKYHLYPEQAAAALWTNPTDIAKYIIETQLSLQGKSCKVLLPKMTTLRLTPFVDSSAAMGVFIIKKGTKTYFQHSGWNEGFVSEYFGSMTGGNGVVVMANSDNGAIVSEIINSVATVYNWVGFYQPKFKKSVAVEDRIMNNYVGGYKVNDIIISIKKEKNKLVFIQGGQKRHVHFINEKDFFLAEVPNGEYSFITDANNVVTAIQLKRKNTTVFSRVL